MPEGDKKVDWFLWLIGISCLTAINIARTFLAIPV